MPANQKRTSKPYYEVQAETFHEEFLLVAQLRATAPEIALHHRLKEVQQRLRNRRIPGGRRFSLSIAALYRNYYSWEKNGRSPEALVPKWNQLEPTFGKSFQMAVAKVIRRSRPKSIRELLPSVRGIARSQCGKDVSYATLARVVAGIRGADGYWVARRAASRALRQASRAREALERAQVALGKAALGLNTRKEAK